MGYMYVSQDDCTFSRDSNVIKCFGNDDPGEIMYHRIVIDMVASEAICFTLGGLLQGFGLRDFGPFALGPAGYALYPNRKSRLCTPWNLKR